MLRVRASSFGEELGDGERGLCAPVFGVLGLHLLPQASGLVESFAALLSAPLRLFGLFEAAFDGARGFLLCLAAHDVGGLVYGRGPRPHADDVDAMVHDREVAHGGTGEGLFELRAGPTGL